MALFGDDLAYEAAAGLDDQGEVVDRPEEPDLEAFQPEFRLHEAEEFLYRYLLLYAFSAFLTPSLLEQSTLVM